MLYNSQNLSYPLPPSSPFVYYNYYDHIMYVGDSSGRQWWNSTEESVVSRAYAQSVRWPDSGSEGRS